MNRIICDICGSEYPETEDRCPICSYARQGTEKVAAASEETARTKVKGGRFSSKNVKKRMKAQEKAASEGKGNPNKPLIVVIILLLIAIMLVSAYIAARFLRGRDAFTGGQTPQTTVPTTAAPTGTTAPPQIACTGLVLEASVLDMETLGEQKQLAVMAVPEDTTDPITFVSADPAVAQVTETGLLTAMGPGQTIITITCGNVSKTCTVVCWFQPETTVPTEPSVPETTAPRATEPAPTAEAVLILDPVDASCFNVGETFTIYVHLGDTSISRSKVTWVSSDPKVATVEKGVVTAVGKGTAEITADYEGKKAICTVRCRFEDPDPTEETKGQESQASWMASHTDVSIAVGESFRLTVRNAEGKTADAIWTLSTEGVVTIDGKTITGKRPGTVTLTSTVDGVTMTCIVRVK